MTPTLPSLPVMNLASRDRDSGARIRRGAINRL
eukprot:CAMPEP_0204407476 /NCGR_PEP_ID=MMETSP0470-20130426/8782_1 /ASSEMBLY_ACC=CAM_ASM_000385 /TAXON_ID=2969 /ORGANISM="Oxyrrhis marina" /LENGTH=32 /DNA_ID= /DNA_START= /DNA_END= /DNA_ORIENTATION=